MRSKYKVVNKIRFTISIILLTIIIIGGVLVISNNFKADAIKEVSYLKVEVDSGDNLWKIAKQYRKPNQDIRELVYLIIQVNDIQNSLIYEGQILKVPVEYIE